MAEQEFKLLLNVETNESVKSVGDLKNNIKLLKKSLEDLDIGSKEYQETLKTLDVNQKALKNAMNSTSRSFKDLEQTANGVGESYDALVNKMNALKKEMKQASDEAKRNELSHHINDINDKLKDMDAQNGVFGRNVGNYTQSILKAFSSINSTVGGVADSFGSMGVAVGGLKGPLMGLNGMFTVLSANPFIAVIGALVVVIQQVAKWMKTSEENVNALNLAMAPLTASTTAFKNVMQKLGEWLANGVQWLTNLAKKMHLFSDEMLANIEIEEKLTKAEQEQVKRKRDYERMNAEDEKMVAYLRAEIVQKEKYTAKERIKMSNDALDIEERIAKRRVDIAKEELNIQKGRAAQAGNSAEENDNLSRAEAEVNRVETQLYQTQRRLYSQRTAAIKEIQAETAAQDKKNDTDEKSLEIAERRRVIQGIKKNEKGLGGDDSLEKGLDDFFKEQEEKIDAEWDFLNEELDVQFAEEQQLTDHLRREDEIRKQARKDSLFQLAGITADILGTIADSMDANDERQFKAQKGLQIAQATINTISGAIGAFTQASATMPPPFGQIVGAAQAAAVTAAGIAQIAKIKATKFKGDGSQSSPSSPGVSVNPPAQENLPTMTRSLTGASEEDRLNRMAGDQKVYILSSELEADRNSRKVQVEESSF